jgi:alkylation response protein AidB-like acyl-CoA dehydrogenase
VDLAFKEQEAFRSEARGWLAANVPPEPLPSMDTAAGFEAHREWERRMAADRWSVVSWPEEYGGRDAGVLEWLVFEEEYWRAGGPGRVSQNGIFLLAPTMFEFGTDEQKARYLPPMASGEEIWCQGWSEPNAGSDLAGIRSRAVADGSDFVLTGQKTWCSRGAFAEWMFGLFRTDPSAERHRGLTYFLVPLDAPGVTVRPIAQLDGETGFAEVFLEDVRIPAERVLGGVDQGWKVAMATAGSERGMNLRSPARYTETARRLVDLALSCQMDGTTVDAATVDAATVDDVTVDDVTQAWMDAEAYRLHTLWTVSKVLGGGSVGSEASLNKVWWSEMDVRMHEAALRLLGPAGWLVPDAPDAVDRARWLDGYLFSLAGPIYAGTNEIQRNVIAERVLGLPR